MRRFALLACLSSLLGEVSLGQESVVDRNNQLQGEGNRALSPASNANCPTSSVAGAQSAAASNTVANSNASIAATGTAFSQRVMNTGSQWIPLHVAQAMINDGNAAAAQSFAPASVSGLNTMQIQSFQPYYSQPFAAYNASPNMMFYGFAAPQNAGVRTFSPPVAAGAAPLGYVMSAPTRVSEGAFAWGAASASDNSVAPHYTVYYRGVGAVVLNSARNFPIGDGQTLVPVYVPTPIALPSYQAR